MKCKEVMSPKKKQKKTHSCLISDDIDIDKLVTDICGASLFRVKCETGSKAH